MANRPHTQPQSSPNGNPVCAPPSGIPRFTEPEVRRWPHPVAGAPPAPCPTQCGDTDPLSRICGVLIQQNQLLLEIKMLLEYLAANSMQDSDEK